VTDRTSSCTAVVSVCPRSDILFQSYLSSSTTMLVNGEHTSNELVMPFQEGCMSVVRR